MARVEYFEYTDDLTGGPATTYRLFTWNGVAYRIDLNEANAAELDAFMDRVAAAATKEIDAKPARTFRQPTGADPSSLTSQRMKARAERDRIRTWLTAQGYKVSDRGTIKHNLVDLYYQQHPRPAK